MGTNDLAKLLGDACYGFLTINFFAGLYHIIMGFRRIFELNFSNAQEQTEFTEELLGYLQDSRFTEAEELCSDDVRALPQLSQMAIENRALPQEQLRQLVTEVVQRDIELRRRGLGAVNRAAAIDAAHAWEREG